MASQQRKNAPKGFRHFKMTPAIESGIRVLADLRLLKTAQFAKASGLTTKHAGHVLRDLKHFGYVGQSGGGVIPGRGRAPQIWFLTNLGWHYFNEISELDLPTFKHAKPIRAWSQTMPHRLASVDIFLALQNAMRKSSIAYIQHAGFDFRTIEAETGRRKETTDFLDRAQTKKIIPDAAFHVLRQDGHEALLFLETDMGTEGVKTKSPTNISLTTKLKAYNQYLRARSFQTKYCSWGRFEAFMLLFVTTTKARIERIIAKAMGELSEIKFLILFSTHEAVATDPLGAIWQDMTGHLQSLFGPDIYAL